MVSEHPTERGHAAPGRWWVGVAVAVVTTLLLLEGPGRLLYWWLDSRAQAVHLLSGVADPALRAKLRHDFVDPATKIKYDYDMFLGWRAHPSQNGLTYHINAAGHRGAEEDGVASADVVLLAGGSAAWSYGASDDDHTLAAYLERRLNGMRGGGRPVRVVNLAEQAYGMRQEETVVIEAITRYQPRAVVFYDGVNDAHSVLLGKDPEHFRTYLDYPAILREALREAEGPVLIVSPGEALSWSMTWKTLNLLRRAASTGRGSAEHPPLTPAEGRMIGGFFARRLAHLGGIMTRLGIPTVFGLQPIGYIERPPIPAERFLEGDPFASWWKGAYTVLEDAYRAAGDRNGARTVDLTGVFREVPEQVYIDPVHMTDRGNAVVADALGPVVGKAMGW